VKPTRGYYWIIQYCPDLGRLEAANIGVLLFCPDREIKARMASDNGRIRHFWFIRIQRAPVSKKADMMIPLGVPSRDSESKHLW